MIHLSNLIDAVKIAQAKAKTVMPTYLCVDAKTNDLHVSATPQMQVVERFDDLPFYSLFNTVERLEKLGFKVKRKGNEQTL